MAIRKSLFLLILFLAMPLVADWEVVGPGVAYQRFRSEGRDIHVTRINLDDSRIRVVGTRQSERGMRVSEFAKKNDAIVAINGDYFDEKMRPIGLAVGPCGPWTDTRDTKREGVVAIGQQRARIDQQSLVMDPAEEWIEAAVSGWPMIVSRCRALTAKEIPGSAHFTHAPHPRTAVGLTAGNKKMYFVVADGRQKDVPGLTLPQLGRFMKETLGVCNAINLDGGGSSAMWLVDRVVNKPSDGSERRVSDHLAVVLESDYDGCDVPPTVASMTSSTTRPAKKKSEEKKKSDEKAKKTPPDPVEIIVPMGNEKDDSPKNGTPPRP